ncbi:DUF4249 domain-containing protein [Emticicia agri]|uniref:DUF4249 domain-containing protein n=1 Tax=Emticicia agri TaxID=2492393 RepID=A0A4Q5M2Q2_9BACT|nr:DUF4249 domain-containing protein [Emticicia agri]RYU96542.1 DUF4249 domain-containing protein [Emticicia agri]
MRTKIKGLILVIGLWIGSCVEPFEISFPQGKKILTVDATIIDTTEEQFFTITESESRNSVTYSFPIRQARVEVLVNQTEKVLLTEKNPGIYALPRSFQLKIGNSYKLLFEKSDGTKYESGEEIMTSVPDIDRVYDEFRMRGSETQTGYDPASYIYLDTTDPADEKNNYVWSWKLWEKQSICKSCVGGRYFTSPPPLGKCESEEKYKDVPYFDYACDGNCWDIFYNKTINVFSDIFSNGKPIIGRLIAKIPYHLREGALLEIKQQSVSAAAYRYLKLLVDQAQNTGSLVDTPPAAVIGNIRNVANPDEETAGFFMVSGVRTLRYWLNRENARESEAVPTGIIGHQIYYEPNSLPPDPPRPPLAPCVPGKYRTNVKPEGWID